MEGVLKYGEALFAQGQAEEAKKCFWEILRKEPANKEAYNNLGVIAFQQEDMETAIDYFTKALKIDPYYKDAIHNYWFLLKSTNRLYKTIPILENASERFPYDQEIRQLLHEARLARRTRTKIAILCLPGLQSFLKNIVRFLKGKYDVQVCYTSDRHEIDSAVRWADIVWLEWANELAVHVTHTLPSLLGKVVFCRIHSYEVLGGYLPRIDWGKVTAVIFVADHVQKIACDLYPPLKHKQRFVINNGVDLNRFCFRRREPGYRLAVVGSINHKKNPSMWVHILGRLVKMDSRYVLKVAGQFQELRYKYYLETIIPEMGIKENIEFCGHIDDIPDWLEKERINYLLSTSVFESFGYAIAEAMAMGIKPLIHHFPYADAVWPNNCLFVDIDELIGMLEETKDYNSKAYRHFIEEKYSLSSQLNKIDSLIRNLGTQL